MVTEFCLSVMVFLSSSRPSRRFGKNNTEVSSEGLGRYSFPTGNRVGKFALYFAVFRISFTYRWELPSYSNILSS